MLQRCALVLSTVGLVITIACAQSDPGVTTAIKSKFAADDTVKAYQIDVTTNDRVVTLTGAVETAAAKEHAVTIARQTEGVRDVVDRLVVNPAAVATSGNFRDASRDAGREVREETREGIDRTKEAARDSQERLGDAADRTGAVMTDAAVTSAVKSKFLADTSVSGLKIDVDTKDGIVTLNGKVSSPAEADRAVSMARETRGVKRVVNNLRVDR
jgi:osmotically-inducible protein OsmY